MSDQASFFIDGSSHGIPHMTPSSSQGVPNPLQPAQGASPVAPAPQGDPAVSAPVQAAQMPGQPLQSATGVAPSGFAPAPGVPGAPAAPASGTPSFAAYSLTDNLSNEQIIFAGVYCDDHELFRSRRAKFNTMFPNTRDMFTNEWAVFAILLKEYPKIIPTERFLELFMRTNQAKLRNHKQIDYSAYRMGDSDPYAEFTAVVINTLRELKGLRISESDFEMALEMYKMEYLSRESIQVLEEAVTIISEGVSRGRRVSAGYEDMRRMLNQRFSYLDNINAKSTRRGIITYGANDESEDNSGKVKLVSTFGIQLLDQYVGGIYEGDMVSILAPAKGCKTRFVTSIIHHAIVNGVDVAVWPVENGPKNFEALLRARHFNWLYNRNVETAHKKIYLDSDMIRKGDLSGELEKKELASWNDLKTNKNYGRFVVIDENFLLESFLDTIQLAIETVGAKLIAVDYLQLIQSSTNIQKNERIAAAYIQMLQFLKQKSIAGIFPGQLKQTVVSNLGGKSVDELAEMEMRDSAGESYEVIKTPDVNLALYGTVSDIRRGSMKLLSIPSRNIAPFHPIDLHVEAGTCTFRSIQKDDALLTLDGLLPKQVEPAQPAAPAVVSAVPASLGGVAPSVAVNPLASIPATAPVGVNAPGVPAPVAAPISPNDGVPVSELGGEATESDLGGDFPEDDYDPEMYGDDGEYEGFEDGDDNYDEDE